MAPVAMEREQIATIVEENRNRPAALLTVLQDIQDVIHWLPKDVLQVVAEMLEVPMTRVYRVATFYKALSLEPRGQHLIRVCTGTACHLRGAPAIIDALGRELGIGPGETTSGLEFSLETVNCLGACALAPVVVVDNTYYGQTDPKEVGRILEQYY
jgi:NADH-quinone oxidoreductase subunit E